MYKDHESVKKAAQMIKVPWKYKANASMETHWKFKRYIPQLKRLRLQYGDHGGSRGLNRYIEKFLDEFESSYPGTAVYVEKHGEYDTAKIIATFCGGEEEKIECKTFDEHEIKEKIDYLRRRSKRDWKGERQRKMWHTEQPSIQGTWTPFTFQPVIDANKVRDQGQPYQLRTEVEQTPELAASDTGSESL